MPSTVRTVVANRLGIDSQHIAAVEWIDNEYVITTTDGRRTALKPLDDSGGRRPSPWRPRPDPENNA